VCVDRRDGDLDDLGSFEGEATLVIAPINSRYGTRRARRLTPAMQYARDTWFNRSLLPVKTEAEWADSICCATREPTLRAWAACVVFWDLFGAGPRGLEDCPLRKLVADYDHDHIHTDHQLESVLFIIGYSQQAKRRAIVRCTNYRPDQKPTEGKWGDFHRRYDLAD
jgi:hypothetical protein